MLIPCYTESLTIVKDVVLAAADALLPEKCKRTVYLLDDGKDAEKAAWVAEQVYQAFAMHHCDHCHPVQWLCCTLPAPPCSTCLW